MKSVHLNFLKQYGDISLMLLRVLTGAFLIYGTQDNVFSDARMQEFVQFLAKRGFAWPELTAPLSVYAQFICGALLVIGLFTRWAGWVMAFNFIVAVVMVHWSQDFRGWWPAIVLVFIGLHFAVQGAGRYSVDELLWRDARADRSPT
ncbi:MAG: DoxX family protein [Candidatus Obscuribacterales bacterium]|nr:DoxX family protein [Steroidobacteraceae bacterium]